MWPRGCSLLCKWVPLRGVGQSGLNRRAEAVCGAILQLRMDTHLWPPATVALAACHSALAAAFDSNLSPVRRRQLRSRAPRLDVCNVTATAGG